MSQMHDMSWMQHDDPASELLMQQGSGTATGPSAVPEHMGAMVERGGWMLMAHGNLFVSQVVQGGPRGNDALASTNWLMGMATRKAGRGQLMLRTMLSLEPLTVPKGGYPELFQTGETYHGLPLTATQSRYRVRQLAQIADGGVGDDRQLVIKRGRDGRATDGRVEKHGAHATTLGTVHVDIEVIAHEYNLFEGQFEGGTKLFEDGRHRFAVAVLVGEDHGVDGRSHTEAVEDFAEREARCASGIADQAEAKTARAKARHEVACTADQIGQHVDGGVGIRLFQCFERLLVEGGRLDLQRLEEVVDLPPAGNVAVDRPIEVMAAPP